MIESIKQLFSVCVLIFILAATSASGQDRANDLIVKRDSARIECKISVVNDLSVQYKKVNDPDGPVFHISKADIARIIYGNGETEIFMQMNKKPNSGNPDALIYYPSNPWLFPGFVERLPAWNEEELQGALKFYKSKAKARKVTSIAFASAGAVCAIIGTVLLVNYKEYEDTYGYYTGNSSKKEAGQLLLIGGLGAGIPVSIATGVIAGKYKRKAALVEKELSGRKSVGQVRLLPSFNIHSKSAALSLSCQF